MNVYNINKCIMKICSNSHFRFFYGGGILSEEDIVLEGILFGGILVGGFCPFFFCLMDGGLLTLGGILS